LKEATTTTKRIQKVQSFAASMPFFGSIFDLIVFLQSSVSTLCNTKDAFKKINCTDCKAFKKEKVKKSFNNLDQLKPLLYFDYYVC